MAEKVLEKPTCETCGVDVRPQAMFCYNCGGAVSDTAAEKPELKSESNGKPKTGDSGLIEFPPETKVDADAEAKMEVAMAEEFSDNAEEKKKSGAGNSKLKSAAAMRRKAKSFQAKPVEIVWEEPENSSSVKIIAVAILLTLFALGIVVIAIYLK